MEDQHVDHPERGEFWFRCIDCNNYQVNARQGRCYSCQSENVWPVSQSTKKTPTLQATAGHGRTVIFLGMGRIPERQQRKEHPHD
jgi:hypothetical protein